jgi:WD40 repeat protein
MLSDYGMYPLDVQCVSFQTIPCVLPLSICHISGTFLLTCYSGSVSLSPPDEDGRDCQRVAISNHNAGFDVFDLETTKTLATYQDRLLDEGKVYEDVLPVLHVHDGNLLLGGSHKGRVHLWDLASPKQKVIQILRHPGQLLHLNHGVYCLILDCHQQIIFLSRSLRFDNFLTIQLELIEISRPIMISIKMLSLLPR